MYYALKSTALCHLQIFSSLAFIFLKRTFASASFFKSPCKGRDGAVDSIIELYISPSVEVWAVSSPDGGRVVQQQPAVVYRCQNSIWGQQRSDKTGIRRLTFCLTSLVAV